MAGSVRAVTTIDHRVGIEAYVREAGVSDDTIAAIRARMLDG